MRIELNAFEPRPKIRKMRSAPKHSAKANNRRKIRAFIRSAKAY